MNRTSTSIARLIAEIDKDIRDGRMASEDFEAEIRRRSMEQGIEEPIPHPPGTMLTIQQGSWKDQVAVVLESHRNPFSDVRYTVLCGNEVFVVSSALTVKTAPGGV